MILRELKQYIKQQGCVTQRELSKQFAISGDGVDAMLSVWIKRGEISRLIDLSKDGSKANVRYSLNQKNALALTVTM